MGWGRARARRLELLDFLAQAPRHVDALATLSRMSVANVSQHLQVLRNARLVETEREGNRVVYRLADDSVRRLWQSLKDVGISRLAEIPRIAHEYGFAGAGDGELSRDELRALLDDEDVLLLDVRPTAEYETGHLPGAESLPLEQLPDRLTELPRNRQIVAYCRGAYCLLADEAVVVLRDNGFDAVRVDGGWLEWSIEEGSSPRHVG